VHGTRTTRRELAPSEAAKQLVALRKAGGNLTTSKVGEFRQQISAYAAKQQRKRHQQAGSSNGPTPERLAKGDLAVRPIYGSQGFIEGHRYVRRTGAEEVNKQIGKHWSKTLTNALVRFAKDAADYEDVVGITIAAHTEIASGVTVVMWKPRSARSDMSLCGIACASSKCRTKSIIWSCFDAS
jgi:hypothetical protein